ncbi:winged helix-turn-helix domain-containing protein [Actibacterium sp. D379-3]
MVADGAPHPVIRLRVVVGEQFTMGPGKADLLQGIAETGSISAAGRGMGMSYRRAWSLVEEMNSALRGAAVETSRGGAEGGGARLTELGVELLALYRGMQADADRATAAAQARLAAMLCVVSGET